MVFNLTPFSILSFSFSNGALSFFFYICIEQKYTILGVEMGVKTFDFQNLTFTGI